MAEAEVHRRSTAKVAVTKKHLRIGQARDRKKSRGSLLTNADALRDKQVGIDHIYVGAPSETISVLNPSYHCILTQLKEARESLRSSLDARHQHLFSAIATKLGMQVEDVENLVLDDQKVRTPHGMGLL